MDVKTEIQKAANKVGVAESAANLIADHLIENGITMDQGDIPPKVKAETEVEQMKPASELKVQPAIAPAATGATGAKK